MLWLHALPSRILKTRVCPDPPHEASELQHVTSRSPPGPPYGSRVNKGAPPVQAGQRQGETSTRHFSSPHHAKLRNGAVWLCIFSSFSLSGGSFFFLCVFHVLVFGFGYCIFMSLFMLFVSFCSPELSSLADIISLFNVSKVIVRFAPFFSNRDLIFLIKFIQNHYTIACNMLWSTRGFLSLKKNRNSI